MRLIRITTENNNCFFESVFNSDLIIKPYSKIALSSFSSQLENLNMVIDAQNNEISFSVNGPNSIKILNLPNGTYVSSNIDDFWIQVQQLFNGSMNFNKNEVGRQWFCGIESGRAIFKLMAGVLIAPLSPVNTDLISIYNIVSGGASRLLKRKQTLSSIGNDAYLYIKSPNNKACSAFRCTLNNDNVLGVASGFVLGYTSENPIIGTQEINPANYLYGIRYVDLTQPYKIIVNGIEGVTTVIPQLEDVIEIVTANNEIRYYIYKNNQAEPIVLVSDTLPIPSYNHILNLFPLCLFVGKDTIISNIQFTSDPHYNIVNTHTDDDVLSANNNASLFRLPSKPVFTDIYLQFNNADLASILGFSNSRYPTDGYKYASDYDFIADKQFSLRNYSDSYVVELLNIKLNSMDSLNHGEKSILYIIPQFNEVREKVIFQSPQLIFLNINNTYELNLREIKARVLKNDLSQFRCYGQSEIVMIIKDKDEL